jgi:hypothetical protein
VPAVTSWPDPGRRRGPLRVLPRTDGASIVYDERGELGARTRAVKHDHQAAEEAMHEIAAAEGIPE